jgi:hypothetical protein|tara:strand:- start:597 stop:797 length:201 start_codon:yes stop_codon:yes gene_type:complete
MKLPKKGDKKVWSFFVLAFPTVLIIVLGNQQLFPGSIPGQLWTICCLAFYQFIILKQFLDTYYELL